MLLRLVPAVCCDCLRPTRLRFEGRGEEETFHDCNRGLTPLRDSLASRLWWGEQFPHPQPGHTRGELHHHRYRHGGSNTALYFGPTHGAVNARDLLLEVVKVRG